MRHSALVFCFSFLSVAAYAQNAPPILPTGDAAVAGFSGTRSPTSTALTPAQRLDKTTIDLNGPALRVIRLDRLGGPPQAQMVAAAKPFTATAAQIGQVFALALDDASPPNIYAAASSAYGLPIVAPDADGDGVPDRSRRGAPHAAFMPGLFGPVTANGGPGSIWKIDGRTGAVTLFANVTLAGVANSGPALGGLSFDRASRQLFIADRDTGMIHRFTLDGVERGRFDHGVQTLTSIGLPPIVFDPRNRLNIESPAFDSGNPATWAYAPPARRVFGLAAHGGRIYYAVAAGLTVWSVSLLPDGSFGSVARFEVAVPRGAAAPSAEISEILFDDNGDMLVAERGAPTGAYDYNALAAAGENRVLRFRPKLPNDPPSRDLWFPVPKEYAIGFPPDYRNDNGGIAIGYGYDQAGNVNRAVCGGTLWSTGEQLRNARDQAIVRRLQPGGPPFVNGLQGNATNLLRPQNAPPFETYFIDYDDRFDDSPARGHMGDVVIWRTCGQAALPIICPVGWFNIGGICLAGLACPPGTEFANGCCGYRGCPASYVRINGRCVPPPTNCGEGETYSEGRCQAPRCPPGQVVAERKFANSSGPPQRSTDCGPGETFSNDRCQPTPGGGPKMCSGSTYCKCPEGTRPSEDGTCKQSSCGPHMVESHNECICEDGYQGVVDNNGRLTCVPPSQCDAAPATCCPPGFHWSRETHSCLPDNQNQPPKLKITKRIGACYVPQDSQGALIVGQRQCVFAVTIFNEGPASYSGPISFTDQSSGNPISAQASQIPPGWTCTTGPTVTCQAPPGTTIPPMSAIVINVLVNYTANSKGENCVALGNAAPVSNSTPSDNVSCAPFCVGGASYCLGTQPPATIGCADGSARNSDGNCPTPPRTCADGRLPVDGVCPTPTCLEGRSCDIPLLPINPNCQPPKIMSDGRCVCPAGTEGADCHKTSGCGTGKHMEDGECVRNKKKKARRKKPTEPSSTQPPIELNIGIGIGGGGRGGGHRSPTPRTPTPRGGG